MIEEDKLNEAKQIFDGTDINITTEGHKYLGGVIGNESFKESYTQDLVDEWVRQIKLMSEIAKSEPQAVYAAFTAGFINKFSYHIRVIENFATKLQPVEDAISQYLIPALTERHRCSQNDRKLLSLPVRLGGLSIPILTESAPAEHMNSKKICHQLYTKHNKPNLENADTVETTTTTEVSKTREKVQQNTLNEVRLSMNAKEIRSNDLAQQKGASNWLTALPLESENFNLSKREFFDALATRYGWELKYLPSTCACSKNYSIEHALSCPKGGFIYQRHNELRDTIATMVDEICNDVKIEPPLETLSGEQLNQGAVETEGARSDISARSFWVKGQRAFFDVRVFNPYAQRYLTKSLKSAFATNENEKKRKYNRRIIEVEKGSFTPLIFSTNGGMGRECESFVHALAIMLAKKRDQPFSCVINWVRTKLSYALTRSTVLCIRGSRTIKSINIAKSDIAIVNATAFINTA